MLFDLPRLRRYRELGYNVLMSGHAGVGKTAAISEAFAGLKWKYFSASTMDPWVDLVGVPRAITDDKGSGMVLDLVRPAFVKHDEIEAIFIDELNRAPDKVLNALMELIQFKSINGHKLNNLKVIWAAVNPFDDGDQYAVNKLDRALTDRFHVQLEIEYKCDLPYFQKKYPEIGEAFVAWWNDLSDANKAIVSPRRLDYAAEAYLNGCHLADFLPKGVNIAKLKSSIKALPFAEQLAEIRTEAEAKAFLKDINKATKLLQLASNKDPIAIEFFEKWKKIMPQELVDALAPHVDAAGKNVRTATLSEVLAGYDKLGPIGDYELTRAINEPAFAYTNGTTLEEEVKRLMATKGPAFRKLIGHAKKVMSSAPKQELFLAMIKPDGSRTNLTTVTMYCAAHDKSMDYFSKEERKRINAHTYLHGAAASKWM